VHKAIRVTLGDIQAPLSGAMTFVSAVATRFLGRDLLARY
jgi:hypothetical protein